MFNGKAIFKVVTLMLLVLLLFFSISSGEVNANSREEYFYGKEALRDDTPEGMVEILILLKDQVDTKKVALQASEEAHISRVDPIEQKLEVRKAVVTALQKTAQLTQGQLLSYLEDKQEVGRVNEINSYFIMNVIFAQVDEDLVDEIKEHPDVQSVRANEIIELIAPEDESFSNTLSSTIEWNIEHIKAPDAWKRGIDGSGVVVGVIDTGVDWEHEALKAKYRGYNHSRPNDPDHRYNWFDPYHYEYGDFPDDWHFHGTHVCGTVLGSGPDGKNRIGVAPGAKWIAARGLDDLTGSGTMENLLAAGQFLLAPTPGHDGSGTPDPSKAPDIIVNSWGAQRGLDEWYRPMVQNWRSARIFPVFAAGNSGNDNDVAVPGNYPESFTVANITSTNSLAILSSRGPSPYDPPNDLKPDISAPGTSIRSAVSWNPERPRTYGTASGTSMAAPHIAGTAALLLQSAPYLNVNQLEKAIIDTALPLEDTNYPGSPNFGYGYGLVNAADAAFKNLGDALGFYDNSNAVAYLKYFHAPGPANVEYRLGPRNNKWTPLVGDWNMTGTKSLGFYDNATGMAYLKFENTPGHADVEYRLGPRNNDWTVLVGDWNGDGGYSLGFYDNSGGMAYIKFENTPGHADVEYRLGPLNNDWTVLVGDWNGDGIDSLGFYDNASGMAYLKFDNTAGFADVEYRLGPSNNNWTPLVGDWNGDGIDSLGFYDNASGMAYLKFDNTAGFADAEYRFGPTNNDWNVLVGDWNNNGMYSLGFYDNAGGVAYIKFDNKAGFADVEYRLGPQNNNWTPLVGRW